MEDELKNAVGEAASPTAHDAIQNALENLKQGLKLRVVEQFADPDGDPHGERPSLPVNEADFAMPALENIHRAIEDAVKVDIEALNQRMKPKD